MAKEDVKLLIGADGQKAITEIQKVTQQMGGLGAGVNNLLSTAGSFLNWQTAAVGAISAAGAAFGKLMVDALNTADEMANMSKRTGIAVESLSRLSYVAKMSDTDMGTLQKSMKFLNTALYDVSKGNQAAIDKFAEFGIEVRNADGTMKTAEQALIATAEAYTKLSSDAAKTALATEIFGKAGQDLMPMLGEGAEGIKNLTDEAERMGVVVSSETAAAAEEFNDKLDKMKTFAQGVAIQVLEDLVPSINDLNGEMDQFNKDGGAVTKTANSITTVIDIMAFAFNNLTWPMRTVLGLLGDLQQQEKTMDKFTGVWTQSQKIGANAGLMLPSHTPTTPPGGGGGGYKGGRGGSKTAGGDTTRIRPRSGADSGFGLADQWWASLTATAGDMVEIPRQQFDLTLQSQLDFIDASKSAYDGYFSDVQAGLMDHMAVLGDAYGDSLGGFASMFEAFANTQAQQQGVMFETARAFRAAEIVASTWTSAQKAYEYGMTFGPWTAGIMMASAIATGVGNLTNLYAAQPGTASINGGGASAAPTPNFQQRNPTGGSGGGSSRNITIKFEGFIWDKDRLAREIVPAINRAISDGVGR